MLHLDIIVTGKVQGVFYRATAKKVADEIGIHGFVQNEPDGSVFIAAEAAPEKMEQFLAWCRRGPQHALVTAVHTQEGTIKGYRAFEVRRRSS
jgi:acylphosphatase